MDENYPPLSPLKTGVRGLCPRCGRGRLFDGFLTLRNECEVCGLDYSFADPADGPALAVAHQASIWTQIFVTGPFMILTCIPPLRPLKGWLVASQYYYKVEEGKLSPRDDPSE
jgi:uncharacterized protein (DUF983 family)